MEDSEVTQTETEVTVASTGFVNIIVGPDGRINDPLLLELLRAAVPLPPGELLKLATFFRAYPSSTNAFLGERLLLTALTTIVTDPRLQEVVKAIIGQDVDITDWIEDAWPGDPTTSDEGAEDPKGFPFYKHLSVSGIGLLIEGRVYEGSGTLYFFAGVSPSPAALPFELDATFKSGSQKPPGKPHIPPRPPKKK